MGGRSDHFLAGARDTVRRLIAGVLSNQLADLPVIFLKPVRKFRIRNRNRLKPCLEIRKTPGGLPDFRKRHARQKLQPPRPSRGFLAQLDSQPGWPDASEKPFEP